MLVNPASNNPDMPVFTPTLLVTQRLALRWLDDGDAAAQFVLFSDPAVMHFIREPWTQMSQAEEMLEQALASYRDGSNLIFGVELRETGELIGNVNLHRFFESNRRCEVGYAIASAHQGRGYATEALAAVIEYGFRTLDLNRFEADINPANTASARVLERLGFRQEGLMRERWIIRGTKQDSAFYGLLKSDWDARQ
jgi:RimJ/RimL family protein N-acetyltransferase